MQCLFLRALAKILILSKTKETTIEELKLQVDNKIVDLATQHIKQMNCLGEWFKKQEGKINLKYKNSIQNAEKKTEKSLMY